MRLKAIVQAAQKGDLRGCLNYQLFVDGKPVEFMYPDKDTKRIDLTTQRDTERDIAKLQDQGPVDDPNDTSWMTGKDGQYELF